MESIRANEKKLKIPDLRKELNSYTRGASKKMSKEELIDKYIEYKTNLVDDYGDVYEPETPYERDGKYYCCGEHLHFSRNKGLVLCLVCGCEYQDESK